MLQGETKSRQERIEENDNTADIIGMYGTLEKAYACDERPTYQTMDTQQERWNDVRGGVSDQPMFRSSYRSC